MKTSKSLLSLLILLCATTAQAQMYKWVGPDGKVTYSDVAPPSSVKQVETKSITSGGPSTVGLPYELSEAVKNSPVRLYTTPKCQACDEGRKLLNARGIPFSEKTVTTNPDIEQLRQSNGGDTQLPLLFIGRNKQSGFETGIWNSALTSAGYPESSRLPGNYRNASPEPLVPTPKAATENQQAKTDAPASSTGTQRLPPTGNAPPGFRF